jgi:DNA-binding transcriptional ArsR family regulator
VTPGFPPGPRLDGVFGALADPTRRDLLTTLLQQGPATATVLAGPLPISRQAVVKHLQVLESAQLARPARQGREVHWTAQPAPLVEAAEWLVAAGSAWERRLERLRASLGRTPDSPEPPPAALRSSGPGP